MPNAAGPRQRLLTEPRGFPHGPQAPPGPVRVVAPVRDHPAGVDSTVRGDKVVQADTPPLVVDPASPPPPPTGPGFCNASSAAPTTFRRFAQTFLPPAGTEISEARVFLRQDPANFGLVFQIRTANASGEPAPTVLGEAIVSTIPATALDDQPQQIDALFLPVTITPGQLHALVVTGPSTSYQLSVNPSDTCPDGKLFFDVSANDTFTELVNTDLVFAVTLV
jgi:hypothetical protein